MMKNWKKYTLAMCGFGLVSFGMLGGVSAQDCEQDSDCGDGMICELHGSTSVDCPEVPPCGDGEDCPEVECEEEPEVFGECISAPIECDTDADCPDYLACQSHGGEDALPPCFEDEEGNLDCPEEPVEEGSVCVYKHIDCEFDSDCPSDFYCVGVGVIDGCSDAACADGEDCPDVECESEERQVIFACVPRPMDCETDNQCPTDWSCQTFTYGACEGIPAIVPGEGTSEGSEGGRGEEAPPPEDDNDDDHCNETIVNETRCIPPGFTGALSRDSTGSDAYFDAYLEENGIENSPADSPQDDSNGQAQDVEDEDEDAGGCSVGTSSRGTGNSGLMIMLAGFIFMATRRRRQG